MFTWSWASSMFMRVKLGSAIEKIKEILNWLPVGPIIGLLMIFKLSFLLSKRCKRTPMQMQYLYLSIQHLFKERGTCDRYQASYLIWKPKRRVIGSFACPYPLDTYMVPFSYLIIILLAPLKHPPIRIGDRISYLLLIS